MQKPLGCLLSWYLQSHEWFTYFFCSSNILFLLVSWSMRFRLLYCENLGWTAAVLFGSLLTEKSQASLAVNSSMLSNSVKIYINWHIRILKQFSKYCFSCLSVESGHLMPIHPYRSINGLFSPKAKFLVQSNPTCQILLKSKHNFVCCWSDRAIPDIFPHILLDILRPKLQLVNQRIHFQLNINIFKILIFAKKNLIE